MRVKTDSVEGRPTEDSELVERARHGDQDAYAELVTRYQALAVRTAYVIAGNEPDAEEAAQEGFVKAYYALDRFRAGASAYRRHHTSGRGSRSRARTMSDMRVGWG